MLLILLAAAVIAPPEPIVGRASVIDGDTIDIRGQRIRLWGIDAPEGRQTCTRGGRTYRCGQEAALFLADHIIQSRPIYCVPRGRPDRYRRVVAVCSVVAPLRPGEAIDPQTLGLELNGGMVTRGWALDFPRYSGGAYTRHERLARGARSGIWAGEFQRPWEWRPR